MNVFRFRSTLLAAATLLTPMAFSPAQEPNPVPTTFKSIYPAASAASGQLHEAFQMAAQQHKNVVLDFGADQCSSCQVTATFFPEAHVHAQIAEHFLLVHINVGPKAHQNTRFAQSFGVDLSKGLPALAVVDPSRKVLGTTNEFAKAQNMSSNDLLDFLNKSRG